MAWPRAKDVCPGLGCGKGDLIGCNAYGGPISSMEFFDIVHDHAGEERSYIREACGGPGTRAGKAGERVNEEVVEDLVEGVLLKISILHVLIRKKVSMQYSPREAEEWQC